METHTEARIGSLIAAAGIIWAVYVATRSFTGIDNLLMPTGPLEVCGLGVLIWLHSKWRGSVRAH